MNEEQIRAIVQDEMAKNYNSGSPDIPAQRHNNVDGLPINPINLVNFQPLPFSPKKYTNEDTGLSEYGFGFMLQPGSAGHAPQSLHNSKLAIYPEIIIQGNGGGTQSAFNGGWAPDGTRIFFDNGLLLSKLWIRSNGNWYGFTPTDVM